MFEILKPSPRCGAHFELAAFKRHQHAAAGAHGLDRKIHDHLEQFVQRTMPGQLAAGADQRAHLRAALHHVGLVQIVDLRPQHGVEVRDHRGGRARKALAVIDEHHRIGGAAADVGELDGQMPGGDAVAHLERHLAFRSACRSAACRSCCPDLPRTIRRWCASGPDAGAKVRRRPDSKARSRWSGPSEMRSRSSGTVTFLPSMLRITSSFRRDMC